MGFRDFGSVRSQNISGKSFNMNSKRIFTLSKVLLKVKVNLNPWNLKTKKELGAIHKPHGSQIGFFILLPIDAFQITDMGPLKNYKLTGEVVSSSI